jgi:hypothetical protein
LAWLAVPLLALVLGAGAAQAGGNATGRYFPDTGQWLRGGFVQYWNTNGGAAVFGSPITPERNQRDSAGRTYTEQYLVNAVLEYHANLPKGRQIVQAPLGRLRYAAIYPGQGYRALNVNNAGGGPSRYFSETGAFLGGGFLTWWQGHHGAQTLGAPITGEFSEDDPTTRKPHMVQYFEFGELQYRPENRNTRNALIAPLPLGRLWLNRGGGTVQTNPPPAPKATATPRPAATPTPVPPPGQGGGGTVALPPVGQTIVLGGANGGRLTGTVTAVQEATRLDGINAPSGSKFITIGWRVTNSGTAPEAVGTRSVALQDSRGRVYAMAALDVQQAARTQYRRNTPLTLIPAGQGDDELIVFTVPTDVTTYSLVPAR